ncbi:MAG: M23 family metallopeptidase [Deltaproteobacteria bacterium]|nr:M23 family metallopeptidase [Deltaproteobacteria bacterium]
MHRRDSDPLNFAPAWLAGVRLRSARSLALPVGLLVYGVSAVLSFALLDGIEIDFSFRTAGPAEALAAPPEPAAVPSAAPVASLAAPAEGMQVAAAPAEETAADPLDGAPTLDVVTGRVPPLHAHGVAPGTVYGIAHAMRPVFDFRKARPNDFFALVRDDTNQVLSFEYRRGRSDIYRVERHEDGHYVSSHQTAPLERRVVQLGGVIDTSLFGALTDLGERPELVNKLADIFVWDFDFSTQTRPGDEFRLVYEKFYDREGFVRYGAVLAAQYRAESRDMTAVYFEDDDGYGDYFTPQGNSVRRTFLRAPVKYSRISARYSNARLHPILKVRRPHQGIDYAAPTGTPIWSVAEGEVVFKGYSGGFGRLVKVRHNNGYISYYGHLSRFGGGIEVGRRVKQKQILGYVGSSGLATGPHLDYRLRIDGRFVDPLRVRFPKGEPISVEARGRFESVRARRMLELNSAQPAMVLEAAM